MFRLVSLREPIFSRKGHSVHGDSMHQAPKPVIIVYRLVPCRSIVPHGDVSCLPANPTLELRLLAVLVKHRKDGVGFAEGQTFDMRREYRIHEQAAPPAERVRDDDRVSRVLFRCCGIPQPSASGCFAVERVRSEDMPGGMHGPQAIEEIAHLWRECLIGRTHRDE